MELGTYLILLFIIVIAGALALAYVKGPQSGNKTPLIHKEPTSDGVLLYRVLDQAIQAKVNKIWKSLDLVIKDLSVGGDLNEKEYYRLTILLRPWFKTRHQGKLPTMDETIAWLIKQIEDSINKKNSQ